jgi:hypothetical protein
MNEHKYLPIHPSKDCPPENVITRKAFLDAWADFAVRKPFIFLVGSLSNWAESHGDIDILVKAHDPTPLLDALDSIIVNMFEQKKESIADLLISVQKYIATESLFLNAKWRIERAFPDWKDKIHVLDDSFSGPFTNFVELADLVAVSRAAQKREEMDTKELSRHRRDRCMICANPPVFEVLWAEGRAHAWFCEKHLKKFVKDSFADCLKAGEDIMNCGSDIVSVKEINDGEASKNYAENKNSDLHTKFIEEARTEIRKLISEGIKELELDPEIENWFRNNLPFYPGGTSDTYPPPNQHLVSSAPKKVELFHPVPLLKPIHGRAKGEIYSIDSVIDTIKSRKKDWFKANIAVQNKFDGVHVQAHVMKDYESGKIARVFTEEGTEITKNCPTIIKHLSAIPNEFIVIGEIELWKEGKHQNRAIAAGVLNTKLVHPDESSLVFNYFDCLFHNSTDIHMLRYSERIRILNSFVKKTKNLKPAETRVAKTEKELRAAISYFSKQEGSEGAYLKLLDFPYLLTGKTTENIKFKNELSLELQIVKVNIVGDD